MKFYAIFICLAIATTAAFSQRPAQKRLTPPANTSAAAEPSPTPSAKEAFETARAFSAADERVNALEKFLVDHPESEFLDQAKEILTAARGDHALALLAKGEAEKAVDQLELGIKNAPETISERLFNDVILRFPELLFSSGQRGAAIEVAELIETRIGEKPERLVALARFHLSIENGEPALRLSLKAAELRPDLSSAFQSIGFAHRLNFDLTAAETALVKAVELDADNLNAALMLADISRANGKIEQAAALYDSILEKEPNNPGAQSGKVLSLFALGKKAQAEAAFDAALKANPGNVSLIGSVAYWYAALGDADNAILHAEEAIDLDPRYVWAHIAHARGLMMKGRFADAEQVLVKAKSYGRFPTLEYELAAARVSSGFYLDAVTDLANAFSYSDGAVTTKLGGRVLRSESNFEKLLEDERRASISIHRAPEQLPETMQLTSLLMFKTALDNGNSEAAVSAANQLASASGPMKVFRTMFAAESLLKKDMDSKAALELTRIAASSIDEGIASPVASSAVIADELFERRRAALAAGRFVVVPEVPRQTLSAVMRGRIEETAGWAYIQEKDLEQAEVRLLRAITVLPSNSAWWRSSTWRLGTVQESLGKDEEALASYAASYRSEPGSSAKYLTIRAAYQRVHGNLEKLEEFVGPDPVGSIGQQSPAPSPTQLPEKVTEQVPPNETSQPETKIEAAAEKEIADPVENKEAGKRLEDPIGTDAVTKQTESKPADTEQTKATDSEAETETSSRSGKTVPKLNGDSLFEPIVISIPRGGDSKKPVIKGDKESSEMIEKPLEPADTAEEKPNGANGKAEKVPEEKIEKSDGSTRGRLVAEKKEPSDHPCSINVSQNQVVLANRTGSVLILVGTGIEADAAVISASSSSPDDIEVRAEPAIEGISGRSLFLISSRSTRTGDFQVTFKLPCGEKVINVSVN